MELPNISSSSRSSIIDNSEPLYAGHTHVGQSRAINQDAFAIEPQQGLFLVADGMGGHAAGEVAARIAIDATSAYMEEVSTICTPNLQWPYRVQSHWTLDEKKLANAVQFANTAIFQAALEDSDLQGMGTTIAALHISHNLATWAHVGDSRIYRLRERKLEQLTHDHSLLNEQLERQQLQGEEADAFARNFPFKNVLIRAMGTSHRVEVDVQHASLCDNDLFMICSDGVHGLISDEELTSLIIEYRDDLDECCQRIIARANEAGGHDNITVVLVETR